MKTFRDQIHATRRRAGLTLLEIVLALAVFSIAALALVGTINQIADAGTESQQLLEIEQSLESLIDEYGKMPQIREMDEQIKPGADGVAYRVLIEQVKDLQNQDGRFLQNTFRVLVVARWDDGSGPFELQAETYRYAGAFLPVN
ncbi:prepilin-type N-terminal cleavage/methylation domain-containing protein [Prosthecobacter debontii]|uniref:Prepilin-type N-terminal cleavage/methylation domain-containing protein n=1 Tax=Prosthecobacter debontii TaxID=48467 RepID=A0A1T4WVU4_9BACT|nr:type II secretion system protein [Prosthecobacter debontii]SKA81490.1 prepilin-type N-terminal cleavage/methylation domain-containing protein [Prosthecobacter debontii]